MYELTSIFAIKYCYIYILQIRLFKCADNQQELSDSNEEEVEEEEEVQGEVSTDDEQREGFR